MVLDVQLTADLTLLQCHYQEDGICGMTFICERVGMFFTVVSIRENLPEWLGMVMLVIENKSIAPTADLLKILSPHKEAIQHYYKLCIEQQFGG